MTPITDEQIDRILARAASCVRAGKGHASLRQRSDAERMARRAASLLILAANARLLQACAAIPTKTRNPIPHHV